MTKQTNEPLVTVYITSFNYRPYIEQAIESVLQQTLQNFELIIIDDGSSDGSQEIIKSYEGHPKTKCIFQNNKGLNVTNNIAMRLSQGRYIMRLDADDWLDPNALELMTSLMERNDHIGLVFPDYYKVNSDGELIEQVRRHSFDEVSLYDQPAHGACTMIRISYLRELGGYNEAFTCQDGYDLWIRFIKHHEVKNINLPLFYYRQHGANLTRNEERILATRAEIMRKMTDGQRKPLKVIAVIAVRGPNVDPQCLSMKELGKKLLIDWSIEAACSAEKIHKVVLDTPDNEIYDYVKRQKNPKLIAILRPKDLGKKNTPIRETLCHALDVTENQEDMQYEALLQLAVESPFRNANHLDSAIRVMELFDTDIVIGVRMENDNFFKHNGHGLIPVSSTNQLRLERDDIYREAGSMRLLKRGQVVGKQASSQTKIGHIVFDQKASMRLVSQLDWDIAEFLASCE